jgi:hypothetical protein
MSAETNFSFGAPLRVEADNLFDRPSVEDVTSRNNQSVANVES